jgi:outer membrane protein assembly factor BamB
MKQLACIAFSSLILIEGASAAPVLSIPHVLVSSTSLGQISRVNASTGQYIDTLISGLHLASGAPMAVGPDGNLYLGSFSGDVIHKINIHNGAYYGIFATGADGVRGLDFGPNGNLFVAAASANVIKEYNGVTGQFIRNFISVSTPIDLVFGPSNTLYVARGHHQISPPSSILRFNSLTGAPLGVFSTQQVDTPQALLVRSDGDVYVTNQWSGTDPGSVADPVVKFDGATSNVEFAASGLGNSQGLLLLPDNTLLVATESTFLNRYNADTGALIGTFLSDSRLGTTSDLIYVVPEPSTIQSVIAILLLLGAFDRSPRAALHDLSKVKNARQEKRVREH